MVLLVNATPAFPTVVDDDGTGQSGTIFNEVFFDQLMDSIDDILHSAANPTESPASIIDEVVEARGSKDSLDDRLDVSLNEDGTLKTQASLASLTQVKSLIYKNLLPNSDLLLWPDGDAAAPWGFTLSGTGAAVARTGTGLGDTQRFGYGDFAAKLTYGSTAAKLTRTIMNTTDLARFTGAKGRNMAFACKALTSIPNHASIVFDDGATQTRGGQGGNATYHTGGGTEEWLYGVHPISQSATKLEFYLETATSGAAYFGDILICFGDIAPSDFIPTEMQAGVLHFPIAGNATTGTKKFIFTPGMAGIIMSCLLRAETAPTVTALIYDVNTWDGAAFTTAFTTKPQIAAAAFGGIAAPDGAYARRCFRPTHAATPTTSGAISIDCDAIGTVPGADITIEVRVKQYIRVLEPYYSYDFI
jgi:hypothetical protein